jgi:hypothetical protein
LPVFALAVAVAVGPRDALPDEDAPETPARAAASTSAAIHAPSHARRFWELPISSPPVRKGHVSRTRLRVFNTFGEENKGYRHNSPAEFGLKTNEAPVKTGAS